MVAKIDTFYLRMCIHCLPQEPRRVHICSTSMRRITDLATGRPGQWNGDINSSITSGERMSSLKWMEIPAVILHVELASLSRGETVQWRRLDG